MLKMRQNSKAQLTKFITDQRHVIVGIPLPIIKGVKVRVFEIFRSNFSFKKGGAGKIGGFSWGWGRGMGWGGSTIYFHTN